MKMLQRLAYNHYASFKSYFTFTLSTIYLFVNPFPLHWLEFSHTTKPAQLEKSSSFLSKALSYYHGKGKRRANIWIFLCSAAYIIGLSLYYTMLRPGIWNETLHFTLCIFYLYYLTTWVSASYHLLPDPRSLHITLGSSMMFQNDRNACWRFYIRTISTTFI